MRNKLFAGVAFAALMIPASAYAQSTGSTEFEESEIVVTGVTIRDVGGIELPDTAKSKVVISSELIQRQRPGQTVNDIINLSPGVSFQNNDATGAAGGTFTIRGFDSTRISQTIDGIPLNDTGNYAIYSNQQQDAETLDSISVNLGSTDVDSPTASASGGTVNIRTRVPSEDFHVMLSGLYGDYVANGSGNRPMFRIFGMVDTGDFTGFGTRAFFSASRVDADNPFNNYGKLAKTQVNGRIYQEIGGNGDFVSVAGHYNENRNNFFGSGPLRTDRTAFPNTTTPRTAGTGSSNRFPGTGEERFYKINYPCLTDTAQAGVADVTNSCGTEFDRRYNPSNTGNIRGSSRFTLAEGLTLFVDPSFQYVKANGGGTVTGREGGYTRTAGAGPITTPLYGYIGNNYYLGRDLNGDGDAIDTCTVSSTGSCSGSNGVTLIAPSQTTTRRYIVNATLAYELNDNHRVRVGYTFDRGRHRQTGELGFVHMNGEPFDVFSVNDPVLDALGKPLQKRDRLSIAKLQQVFGEYRGIFGDLTVVLGVTGKFFTRDLTNNCFTTSASGFVDCVNPSQNAAYAAANPYTFNATTGRVTGSAAPQQRNYKYNSALPSVGLTFDLTNSLTAFASYQKGISVPGTDVLYSAFYYPTSADQARPKAESTDSFDAGFRYRSGRLTAQVAGWYTGYKNRIATAYDPELDQTITRNLGDVTKWGFDGSISFEPTPKTLIYVFGSYLSSKIKDDLLIGNFNTDNDAATPNVPVYYATGGKREAGAPVYTFGARAQASLGPVDLGVQFKRTGKRYVNDENLPVQQCFNDVGTGNGSVQRGTFCASGSGAAAFTPGTLTTVYGSAAPAYNLVDLDLRINMANWGADSTYLQFNVSNLFDDGYVGGFGGSGNRFAVPFVQFGVPRAVTAALVVGF